MVGRVRLGLPAIREGVGVNPMDEQSSVTTWAAALQGPLAGATCLWQDLDGIHREPAPDTAPPTHVVWAWTDDAMVRVRLDGEEVFLARLSWPLSPADPAPRISVIHRLPWAGDDKRVAAVRPAGDHTDVLATRWIVVRDDGLSSAAGEPARSVGAITFLRPA